MKNGKKKLGKIGDWCHLKTGKVPHWSKKPQKSTFVQVASRKMAGGRREEQKRERMKLGSLKRKNQKWEKADLKKKKKRKAQ